MIVATAGHVDHGKTELIKALTGTDTDRLPEEKARGLSIDLGFAYKTFSGAGLIGFVDVPGHEKFVRNMLAGVAGIDLGLLVVAADDGVMPQTREHLAILNLLGIEKCLIALTKIDRVRPNRINEMRANLDRLFIEFRRERCGIFPVCAPKHEGIDSLSQALAQHAMARAPKTTQNNFRMAIDRVFTLKGIGLIVTGMVFSGLVRPLESLTLSSNGSSVRIRGIRANGEPSDGAKSGDRCALNITGRRVDEHSVRRGSWLMHADLYNPTTRIDVDLEVLSNETRPLKHWTPTHLHVGTDHLPARLAVLSGSSIAPGTRSLAQLVLSRETFVCYGDKFVLRDQSARRTIAGGRVIDPFSPKRGRARPSRIANLMAMCGENPKEILREMTNLSKVGVQLRPFAVSHNMLAPKINSLITSLQLRRVGNVPNERVFCSKRWKELLDSVEEVMGRFHKLRPSLAGANVTDINKLLALDVDTATIELALAQLVKERRLDAYAKTYHLPSHSIDVSEKDRRLLACAIAVLSKKSSTPPSLHQVANDIGVEVSSLKRVFKIAVRLGDVIVIEKNRYLPKSELKRLAIVAEKLAARASDGKFTSAEYRDEVNLGRNFVIAVLEYFDRKGFTVQKNGRRSVRCSPDSVFTVKR
jgi:selenocysteine-specific elongation factor